MQRCGDPPILSIQSIHTPLVKERTRHTFETVVLMMSPHGYRTGHAILSGQLAPGLDHTCFIPWVALDHHELRQ